MEDITIPDSVKSIGRAAFYDCRRLTTVTIPDSVTSIGGGAFSDTSWLKAKRNENPLVIVNHILIDGCTAAGDVLIPDGVTCIGEEAFYWCTNLTSITIPDSVTRIDATAFGSCFNLAVIDVSAGNQTFCSLDGVVYTKNQRGIVCCLNSKRGPYTIPDSVTSISDGAFCGCRYLTSITIPNGVTSIGDNMFYGCEDLTDITIPNSVTSIGDYAFEACYSLESITIPDSVTSIGKTAFFNCNSLTSFRIPDGLKTIESHLFDCCRRLTSITIPDGVTKIGSCAFKLCTGLTSVTIPDSVTSIGLNAFEGCTNLTITCVKEGSCAEQYAIENNIPVSVFGVSLSQSAFQYTGNPVKVGKYISVYEGKKKLKYETDFMLSYKNNVNCGVNTAKVIVEGIGEYAGNSVTMTYSIVPALSTQKGRLHIEWSAVNKADGYQVQYCKDPSFTGDTVHTATVTKLYCDPAAYPKAGETWYVRVRSYTAVIGGKNYGSWSVASSITLGKIDNVTLKYTAFHYKNGAQVKVGKYLTVYSGDTKLKYGTDFTLVYKNNVKRGTASVTIKGIGEYAGSSVTKTYRIV